MSAHIPDSVLEKIAAEVRRDRADPVGWIEARSGRPLNRQQRRIARAVARVSRGTVRVAVPSCHGAGKSYAAARIAMWLLYTHPGSLVVTTAPTARQVQEILWSEVARFHVDASASGLPLGGSPMTKHLRLGPGWEAIGFTATDADRFVGLHREHIFVIIDEAAGVSAEIMEGIEGLMTSEGARMLMIGNPTDPQSGFAKACVSDTFEVVRIPAWETPNFEAFGLTEQDAVTGRWRDVVGSRLLPMPTLITPSWVEERAKEWGIDSPAYTSKVRAQFYEGSGHDVIIPLSWIEDAFRRWDTTPVDRNKSSGMGLDPAGKGSNRSVLATRIGDVVGLHKWIGHIEAPKLADEVAQRFRKLWHPHDGVRIDGDGLGGPIVDNVRSLSGMTSMNVHELHGGTPANDRDRFFNARSEWYWHLRETLNPANKPTLAIQPDTALAAQLSTMRWALDKGRVRIQPKEELGESPDEADAVAMCLAPLTGSGIDDILRAYGS